MSRKFLDHWRSSRQQYGFWEDFEQFVSGDLFTSIEGDSGAATANTDAVGGQVTLTTGATDNNECYLHTTKELFLIANNKPIEVYFRLAFAEGSTNISNVILGLMDAPIANTTLGDNGTGPRASYSGAVFFKEDGQTLWSVETSLATTQNTTQLTAKNSKDGIAKTAAGGAAVFHEFKIRIDPVSATAASAKFFINQADDADNSSFPLVYEQEFTYTSATEMDVVVGIKAGGGTTEIVTVDTIAARQIR